MASKDFNKSEKSAITTIDNSSEVTVLSSARQILYDTINSPPCPNSPFFTKQESNASYKRGVVSLLIKIDNKEITSQQSLLQAMILKAEKLNSDDFNNIVERITLLFKPTLFQDTDVDSKASHPDNKSPKS